MHGATVSCPFVGPETWRRVSLARPGDSHDRRTGASRPQPYGMHIPAVMRSRCVWADDLHRHDTPSCPPIFPASHRSLAQWLANGRGGSDCPLPPL